MEYLSALKDEKAAIINTMYNELTTLEEDDKSFDKQDIEDCSFNLDSYINNLITSIGSENQQKEVEMHISRICEDLSAFRNKNEDWEYLQGFLYDSDYNAKLTNFILKAAFLTGFKSEPERLKVTNSCISYKPNYDYSPRIELFIGVNNDEKSSLLKLNHRSNLFEYEENPYGESYSIIILNPKVSDDLSILSFEVLSAGIYRHYIYEAQYECDTILFNLFLQIHGKGLSKKEIKPNFSSLNLEFEDGMLSKLDTIAYNEKGDIIPVSNPDTGVSLGISYYNEKGEKASKYMLPKPIITHEKFTIFDNQQKASGTFPCYEINSISYDNNKCSLNIKTLEKILIYKIHGTNMILDTIEKALNKRLPFKSRYN